ncbi:hypothetical protein [Labrys monachus]|uniref:Uncharacterized protein n=1 Tax=Labrys monachus TaxID=217067 RepID=A0ABU0F956_9HYPH|nr:hypothetical protein [Labrys monachus]MDQ0391129.1 hypothetical protein [Labrys monachus]
MLSRLLGLALLALALPLGGCSIVGGIAAGTTNNISPKAVYTLRNGYDAAFLAPAANYAQLPRCAADAHFTTTAPCSEASVIRQLQKVDKVAQKALDDLQAFVIANPKLDASALFQAAQLAISNAETAIALYK